MRTKNNQAIAYKVIRAGTRFIYNKAKYESLCDIINVDFRYLHPKYGYEYEILKIAFKCKTGQCPDYFMEYVSDNDSTTIVKSTRNKSYVEQEGNKRRFGACSFKHKASLLWNNLPDNIKEIINSVNFVTFKKIMFEYFLDIQCTARMYDIFDEIDEYEFNLYD